LKHLFCSRSILFVGCSLGRDRTLEVLEKTLEFDPNRYHYALVREDVNEKQIQSWLKLNIRAIRFRRAPGGASFANLPILLRRLADSGPSESSRQPSLLAVIRTPPGGIKDRLLPGALLNTLQETRDRPNPQFWGPTLAASLINSVHSEEPADSV